MSSRPPVKNKKLNLKKVPKAESAPQLDKRESKIMKNNIDSLQVLRIVLSFIGIVTLIVGIILTLAVYIPLNGLLTSLAMFLAPISGFIAFLYLLTTVLLLKLFPKIKNNTNVSTIRQHLSKVRIPVMVIGISLTILNFGPLLTTPACIITAEEEFKDVYGQDWRDEIPDNVNSFFQSTQFNLPNYFLGIPHASCDFDLDIPYYEDNEVKLYFDVYYPKNSSLNLPGKRSIIIKIHGGSWVSGDKTLGNVMPVSKYLAAQGYVVFDIQYGLYDTDGSQWIPTPDNVLGNFTISDMIRHIGIFTQKLDEEYAQTYEADKDSVFIMGGSAGGHLASVVGLGYNDPYFNGVFSENLKLKGVIPYYPPNDAKRIFSRGTYSLLIEGTPDSNPTEFEKFTPSNLADSEDPATMIFQGLQDGLVQPNNSYHIEQALEDEGVDCILLTLPLAAHANDLIVNGNYAQVWLYYLERFLYLEQA